MATYTRVARNEFPSTQEGRRGLMDVNYIYMSDRMETITFTIPLEQDSEERVKQELQTRAAAAAAAGPATITIP